MSGFVFPPPKAGGLPSFPGLGGKGGLPDFSAFAKPRESAVTVMPDFANKVPKKPLKDGDSDSGPWDKSEKKEESHIDTTVATFTCTHKQWQGQLELGANGQFTRIGKDGGTWVIEWEPQRETDDGDKSGELVLNWTKWGAERLRTVDGGRTFKHEQYLFEMELLAAVVPKWITEELLELDNKAATGPPPKPRTDSVNDTTWQRGQSVEDPEEKAKAPTPAPAPEPEAAAAAPAPVARPGRRPRLQFAMPSRQERAAALVRKYSDIGETMANMDGAEPTEIVAFLKKTIGDLHQISTLQMKYKKTVDGKDENREGTPAEILGMPQSALDEMRKARLIRYLENDDEKRIKVLLPVVEQAYEVLKPFLVSTAGSAEEVRNTTLVCPVRGITLQRAQLESNQNGKQFAKKAKAMATDKAQNLLPEAKVKEVESVYGADFWTKWLA